MAKPRPKYLATEKQQLANWRYTVTCQISRT